MSRVVKSGRILESGIVKARDIAATLGLDPSPGQPGTPPLSPADQRRVEEGKKPIGPGEDHEVVRLSEADAWDLWGRPSLSPPANAPDGTPCPVEPKRDYEPARQRPDEGAAMNAPSPEESAAEVMREAAEQAEQIRQATREDVRHAQALAAAAAHSRDPVKIEAATVNAKGALALAQRVKAKIGL